MMFHDVFAAWKMLCGNSPFALPCSGMMGGKSCMPMRQILQCSQKFLQALQNFLRALQIFARQTAVFRAKCKVAPSTSGEQRLGIADGGLSQRFAAEHVGNFTDTLFFREVLHEAGGALQRFVLADAIVFRSEGCDLG